MERLTKGTSEKECWVEAQQVAPCDQGVTGPAIARLYLFEEIYEKTLEEQEQISAQLEQLRLAGKERSARFRELMGKKLTNSAMLSVFRVYGL
jgi:hypothetical protein